MRRSSRTGKIIILGHLIKLDGSYIDLPVLLFSISERRNPKKSRDGGEDPFTGGLMTRPKECENTFRDGPSRLMIISYTVKNFKKRPDAGLSYQSVRHVVEIF
jgi:hypothetical protein